MLSKVKKEKWRLTTMTGLVGVPGAVCGSLRHHLSVCARLGRASATLVIVTRRLDSAPRRALSQQTTPRGTAVPAIRGAESIPAV